MRPDSSIRPSLLAAVLTLTALTMTPVARTSETPSGTFRFLTQELVLVTKMENGSTRVKKLLPVRFVPLTGEH